MRVPRGSVGLLMASVAVVALDLAVFRTLAREPGSNLPGYQVSVDATHAISFAALALGVLPMASLLLLVGVRELPEILQRGTCSGFGLGFLLAGGAAVFLFMSVAALSPALVHDFLLATVEPIGGPIYDALEPRLRAAWWAEAWWDTFELAMNLVALAAPEVLVATLGGWLVRRARRHQPASAIGGPTVPGGGLAGHAA